jgi:hypothetical protein
VADSETARRLTYPHRTHGLTTLAGARYCKW